MAVFLLLGLFAYGLMYKGDTGAPATERGILGGPISKVFESSGIALETASAFSAGGGSAFGGGGESAQLTSSPLPAALLDNEKNFSNSSSREGLFIYKVQKGDTISGIASYFGVSLDTIVGANPGVRSRFLVPGDELKVLPTSGSVYITREGDSLESIAEYFNLSENDLARFNKSVNFNSLSAQTSIVIPGVKGYIASKKNSLPNFNANFVRPADGFNWGKLHHYNAVDIANSCGTSVIASAEGLVIPDDSFGDGKGGWNGGYGSFVLIEHPFGDSVRTRYAHLEKVMVDIGDYIKQGQQIGTMGDTGDATGCHIHFEVYGAENPLAK